MITEDYVSFETAKLLKEKGFKQWCRRYYGVDARHRGKSISFDEECELKDEGFGNEIEYVEGGQFCTCVYGNDTEDKFYAAPTLQMAMKWLRENYEIFIQPNIVFLYPIQYFATIFCYGDNLKTQQDIETERFDMYEQACEAAIKYCLENLI